MSWIVFAIFSAMFAALVAVFGKVGIKGIDSTLATTVRSVVMAGFLVIVSLSLGKLSGIGSLEQKPFLYIVFSGIAGALSWLCYFLALKYGPASSVAALDRLSVVFVLVLAVFFLGEHLTWKSGFGALFITLGAILMTVR